MAQEALTSDTLLAGVPAHEGYKVLGGVVLYEKLGQGGMGAVYRGRHVRLGVDVALKVMAPPVGMSPVQAENFVQRFVREARTAAAVRHPNLIRVYDVNSEAGVYYLIMDYIDGESAGDRLKRRTASVSPGSPALSQQEALEICLGAAEGLAGAHEQGVVHRDVKPDNILIDKKGTVVVADLGLAKAFGTEDGVDARTMGISMSQQAMGTPYYMSPEQTRSAKDVGPAADVWSLGVTLYQLLTNRLPWPDTDISDLFQKIRNDPLPGLKSVRGDVSRGLADIVDKTLRKGPGERYRDCRYLADVLGEHLDSIRESRGSLLADPEAGSTKLSLVAAPPPANETMSLIAEAAVVKEIAPTPAPTPPEAPVPASGHATAQTLPYPRRGAGFAFIGLLVLVALGAGGGAAWYFLGGGSSSAALRSSPLRSTSEQRFVNVESTSAVSVGEAATVNIDATQAVVVEGRAKDRTAGSLVATARTLREAGLHEKARDKLVEALSLIPDHEEARLALREIQEEIERSHAKAERAAECRKWMDRGLELRLSGNLSGAAEAYRKAAEYAPQGSAKSSKEAAGFREATEQAALCLHEHFSLKAVEAEERGDLERAIELCRQALKEKDVPAARARLERLNKLLATRRAEQARQTEAARLVTHASVARAKDDLDAALSRYREAAKYGAAVTEEIASLEAELARRRAQAAHEKEMERVRGLVREEAWKDAASALREVLRSRPGDTGASRLLSQVEGRLGPRPTLTIDLGGGVRLPMVYVKPGRFTMGSLDNATGGKDGGGKDGGGKDERPAHEVVITRGFYIGKYELTQAQCVRVVGVNPSKWKSPNRPVERLSWSDAAALCKKLSEITGRRFRLPTEAEWEYACRAGSDGAYCFGDDGALLEGYAYCAGNSRRQTEPVGTKRPNAWGLHDMHGNVWEWCADRYSETYYARSPRDDPKGPPSGHRRVLRGGSWYVDARLCRSSNRGSGLPTSRTTSAGVRVVCEP